MFLIHPLNAIETYYIINVEIVNELHKRLCRKAQDAELKLYLLLDREIRMGTISASKCFISY